MATTATQSPAATLSDLSQPRPIPIDADLHKKELDALRAEQAARHDEMLRCMNPAYAAMKESQKPVFKFTVECEWSDGKSRFQGSEVVYGQDESDAWSAFCDKLQTWPSRRNCRDLKIVRGKELPQDQVRTAVAGGFQDDFDSIELPLIKVTPPAKAKKR